MKTIQDIDFSGKRALIRVDFNVPLNDDFKITDDTRIKAALPTIKHILTAGGSVVLMSHLGRPKSGPEDKFSLRHLGEFLSEQLEKTILFADDCVGEEAFELSGDLKPNKVLLLENLRFYAEETAGDEAFAEKLSKHGDIYVNDAFGTAHRAHASTAIIAHFFDGDSKCFGQLMTRELESVAKVMKAPKKPFTAIIGGAKVSSKIGIIENLLDKIDNLIIGGGMAYTFAKAKGGQVGDSLVEDEKLDMANDVMKQAEAKGVRILLPKDTLAANAFSNTAERKVVPTDSIPDGWMGLDLGPEASKVYSKCIEESQTILWNGPMGVFEFENFSEGTKSAAFAVVAATAKGAFSLVGGGDSVAAVNKYDLSEGVSYVSTGGGALLELIEGKQLPGVVAIDN